MYSGAATMDEVLAALTLERVEEDLAALDGQAPVGRAHDAQHCILARIFASWGWEGTVCVPATAPDRCFFQSGYEDEPVDIELPAPINRLARGFDALADHGEWVTAAEALALVRRLRQEEAS